YMIPRDLVILEQLPQTPSGKIDRKALPEPDRTQNISVESATQPLGATQETLLRLWRQLLGLDQIDLNTHFFDLGGDSLLILRLSLEIEKTFHLVIALTDLFLAPTIAQQAALIDNHQAQFSTNALVPLQPTGTRAPLFLLPGIGGHAIGLRDLALLLGPEHPVYGLQLRGMEGRQSPLHRIEDIAAYFVEEITRQFPQGPYHFIGFSAGGFIAYEMARQLQQRGAEIALLALLDTYGPNYPRLLPLPRRLAQHLWRFTTLPLAAKGHYLADRWRGLARRIIPERQAELRDAEVLPGSIAAAIALTIRGMNDALHDYRPQPYCGSIAIFQAGDTPDWIGNSFEDPNMGWTPLIQGQINSYRVPGDHLEIVRTPGVRVLAAHLRQTITQAWQRSVAATSATPNRDQ
ncbi:MAG: alpha/beta fold hydrolase, partial [Phycisphaerae bacterium]